MNGPGTLPNFLIIGAQKSATRWLRMNLNSHPEIYTAPAEISFFSGSCYEQGLSWYRGNFKGWTGEPFIGEATPAYMIWRQNVARISTRINESLPNVRLLAILRNPVDRAHSAFIHHIRRGRIPSDADFMDWIRATEPDQDRLSLISGGWYGASLEPYFKKFGPRLKVLLNEDARVSPRRLYDEAVRHIGAEPGFVPEEIGRIRHSAKENTGSLYTDSADFQYRNLSHEERDEVFEYFCKDVGQLEELLDRDLDLWRP